MINKIISAGNFRKNSKAIIIFALLLALAVLAWASFRETEQFRIEDKCGKFVNLMSHTIEDEEKCKTRCIGQCDAEEMKHYKVEFSDPPSGCNECICYCR